MVPLMGAGPYTYMLVTLVSESIFFSLTHGNLAVSQVRMLSIFSRGLGTVFALAGLATVALARNRLSLSKDAYRMAKVIQSGTEEYQA